MFFSVSSKVSLDFPKVKIRRIQTLDRLVSGRCSFKSLEEVTVELEMIRTVFLLPNLCFVFGVDWIHEFHGSKKLEEYFYTIV